MNNAGGLWRFVELRCLQERFIEVKKTERERKKRFDFSRTKKKKKERTKQQSFTF